MALARGYYRHHRYCRVIGHTQDGFIYRSKSGKGQGGLQTCIETDQEQGGLQVSSKTGAKQGGLLVNPGDG